MKEIPLTQGRVTLVDDDSFDELNQFKWYLAKRRNGLYAARDIYGRQHKTIFMHQEILGVKGGDHKDGDGLNNQRSNLRVCNRSQNAMNQRHQVGCSSVFKGVYFDKRPLAKPWTAQIKINQKNFFLGRFSTEKEAALAYNKKAVELFGEFIKPNIIPEDSHERAA